MSDVSESLHPQVLRYVRARSGLSQRALAEKAGISVGYVAMLELGKRKAREPVVEALATALGCKPADLRVSGD